MALNQLLTVTQTAIGFFMVVSIVACSDPNNQATSDLSASQTTNGLVLEIYKRASCSCCSKWSSHLKENGFQTNSQNFQNLIS